MPFLFSGSALPWSDLGTGGCLRSEPTNSNDQVATCVILKRRLSLEVTPRIWRTPLLIFLTCATFLPVLADAQGAATFDPLGVPTPSVMLCRPVSQNAIDSAPIQLEFREGTDPYGQRVSIVFFDSVGTPRLMYLVAPWSLGDTALRVYTVVVRFQPKRIGMTAIVPLRYPFPTSDSVKRDSTIKEILTEPAIAHAEALAKWFWDHRCNEASLE
jgi:hypothetical protein